MVSDIAAAYDTGPVAYITRNPLRIEQTIVDTLEEMGFTVTVLESSELDGVDWSQYLFIVVNDEIFNNPGEIPVNDVKTLILNTWNIDDFHWSKRGSQYASSQPIIVINQRPGHIITQGLPVNITIYTQAKYNGANIPVNYLYRFDKAPKLDTVVSTIINSLDAVIATAEKGTKLRDGVYANEKGVFFGIFETEFWTPQAKQLFENSVEWLLTDTSPPMIIGDVVVEEVTETAARITWQTDDSATSRIDYGTTLGLGEVYEDTNLVTEHNIVLTGLSPVTSYYFNITSCNSHGYCRTVGVYNFTTLDLTPPSFLSIEITEVTNDSATVVATTDEPAIAYYYFGLSPDDLSQIAYDLGYYTTHNLGVGPLSEHTTYYFQFQVCDPSDNCRWSDIGNLTTLDFTPPGAPLNLKGFVINSNNHILLNWSAPEGEPVDHYNIYIAQTPDGFDFSEPFATTSDLSWEDATAPDVSQRFYIVRAEDAYGNEETNQYTVGKFDIPLVEGVNLVSLPLIPFDNSIPEVMHQDGSFHPVYEIVGYDGGTYTTAVFDIDNPPLYWRSDNGLTALENGRGYFFKSNTDYTFTLVGTPATSPQSVQLSEGINLVGYTSLQPKPLSEVIPGDATEHPITEVLGLNNVGSYNIARFYANNPPTYWWFYPLEFQIEPGHGYFFKVTQATVWEHEP